MLAKPVVEIAPRTWLISEYKLVNMYLLEGDEAALLIDCGTGIGNAAETVRELTDKPLTVAITHGHFDHDGAAALFPEIHLHPEWQLLFAELIVLIQKEFGVHILLNTHSPYFLNAIEVYAVKYGINDRCKYYLASSQDDISTIGDVTNNIELIYSKLARPLQELENERGRL